MLSIAALFPANFTTGFLSLPLPLLGVFFAGVAFLADLGLRASSSASESKSLLSSSSEPLCSWKLSPSSSLYTTSSPSSMLSASSFSLSSPSSFSLSLSPPADFFWFCTLRLLLAALICSALMALYEDANRSFGVFDLGSGFRCAAASRSPLPPAISLCRRIFAEGVPEGISGSKSTTDMGPTLSAVRPCCAEVEYDSIWPATLRTMSRHLVILHFFRYALSLRMVRYRYSGRPTWNRYTSVSWRISCTASATMASLTTALATELVGRRTMWSSLGVRSVEGVGLATRSACSSTSTTMLVVGMNRLHAAASWCKQVIKLNLRGV
eukprot:Colp12_sorted_trinity150504_noHs@27841